MVTIKWVASLSDGSTAIEGVAPFEEIDGELSPWLKLREHRKQHGLRVTGLRLQVQREGEPTRTLCLPSCSVGPKGNHERFASLWPIVPVGYEFYRWVDKTVRVGHSGSLTAEYVDAIHAEGRALFPGFALSLIVDGGDGNETWAVVHREKPPGR